MVSPRQSRVRQILATGESASCIKLNLNDPRIMEIAGLAGFDAIWLCNEHVPNNWTNLENQIRAARLYNVDVILRVEKGSYSDYIKAFEMDAMGIMIPHVSSAEEARKIVQMVRPYPLGLRAMDGGNLDGLFCQVAPDDYIRNLRDERLIIVQIESPEALEQVEEIAKVEGIDGILFGPGDFSHALGKYGDMSDPRIAEARKRVGLAAQANGKFAMSAGMPQPQEELEAFGYRLFVNCGDVVNLFNIFREKASQIRQDASKVAEVKAFTPYR